MLLHLSQALYPENSKTNLPLYFVVPEGCEGLRIRFSYAPKNLEDPEQSRRLIEGALAEYAPGPYRSSYGDWKDYLPVRNLITLSVDDPLGYRGCAHRHDAQQEHCLSASFASPGFIKRAVDPGRWRIVLNCHAVVSPSCRAELTVEGCTGRPEGGQAQ